MVLERPSEVERASPAVAPEAIIPEARRRGRRRRALWVLAAAAATGALVVASVVALRGARATPNGSGSPRGPAARSGSGGVPDVVVAWWDYAGVLHLGDLATRRQIRLLTVPIEESGGGMVEDRGRLLWSDAKNRVRSVEIATGRVSVVARGIAVMASLDGSRLYVDQGTTDFLELSPRTLRVTRRVHLPAGWTANPWVARPVAGGLVLMHAETHGVALGIWHPGSKVRPLGIAIDLPRVYTASGGRYSLIAWLQRCTGRAFFGSGCPLAIANTATGRTVTVPSPNRYGFTGGTFSPDGTEFATFVNTDNPTNPGSTPRSELAIVDTATGALRLDPKAKMITTEDGAWALWLPRGRQLLTGAISATYLVNARSLLTRPWYFDGADTRVYSVMGSPDLNFSTLVVPPSALSPKQRRSLGLAAAPSGWG